jgi:PAS domain S-box-containing protein
MGEKAKSRCTFDYSPELFEAILNFGLAYVCVKDRQGRFVYVNELDASLYNARPQDLIGQTVESWVGKEQFQKWLKEDLAVMNSGRVRHCDVYSRIGADRKTYWFDTVKIPIQANGRDLLMVIHRDVTRIKQAEEERDRLRQQIVASQKMEVLGTLAGGIAHDLNNILSPIMTSIEMLKMRADDPQAARIVQTIEASAQRGADIVRQVLSFARGAKGDKSEIHPGQLLKELEFILSETFPRLIRLRFSVAADVWTFPGDATQVHQVLLNLCVNSRDAMPHGGRLDIQIENCVLKKKRTVRHLHARAGRYVKFTVTDSGTGIAPKFLDKIFDPYFTTKEVGKGTGLGLSTVLGIVKGHEGLVHVRSESGRGTTFEVYLPAIEKPAKVRAPAPEKATKPQGRGETILVVDDEASILTITREILEVYGYRVLTAANGMEALALYAQQQREIALVFTDVMMPVMDGPATVDALMKIEPAVKIVMASGLHAKDARTHAPGGGVKGFVSKPYTAATLLKAIRTALDED